MHVHLNEGEMDCMCEGGQTGKTQRLVRSHVVCRLSPCYYALSLINTEEADAARHTPGQGLTLSLCGELGPVTPDLISGRVSGLPAAL